MDAARRKVSGSTATRYLERLSLEDRRAKGQVYTPARIVEFVLRQATYDARRTLDFAPLLDPACGAGVFLEGAVNVLARRLESQGVTLATDSGSHRLRAAVELNLFGVDVDPHACAIARRMVRDKVSQLAVGRTPDDFFSRNVVEADFLVEDVQHLLPPLQKGGFSFIVGNPPYVSATRIEASYKKKLRSIYHSSSGRLDLYAVFFERAISQLASHGRLAFITPDKFLISQSARSLRSLIIQMTAIRSISQFRSHKVFPDADTVPCVTVLERAGRPEDIRVLHCEDGPTIRPKIRVVHSFRLSQACLSSAPWHLSAPDLRDLVERLTTKGCALARQTVRISAGPATGRDSVFVLSEQAALDVEPQLLRRAVRGRDVRPYCIVDPNLRILLPYTFSQDGRVALVNLRDYPKAQRYLSEHRRTLESRHCVRVWRKPWYELHDPARNDLARETKIMVPDVARSNRFAVDEGVYFPLHSAYYLIPRPEVDPHFLAAVLNCSVTAFLIRMLAPVVKDGFNRYRQQFLAGLPVPPTSRREAAEIAAAARERDASAADEMVMDLFGLSPQERSLIQEALH